MNLKTLLLASAALLPALSAQRVEDNALHPNSNLTVGVYAFTGNTDLPSSFGRIFADAVATDLSVLPPIFAVPQGDAGRAAVQVHGQMIDEKGKATVIAKITDAASGRVYGEMVEGGPEISVQDLAAQLSMKIAALVLQLRGLPAAAWPAGALVSTPGAEWKTVAVDGTVQRKREEIPLLPGVHQITASYSAKGSSTRVEFALKVSPAERYRIVLQDTAAGRLNAWVVDRAGLQVTAPIDRVWLRGDDLPIVSDATYLLSGPRYGAAVVADSDALYVIGGMTGPKHLLTDIVRFDLRTHTSTTLTNAIIRRSHCGAVLTQGKIYLFGGQSWNSMLRSMQIYDLASGKLTDGPDMPEARRGFATGLVRNRIYVIGGSVTELNSTPDVVYFDLADQTWKSGPDLPHKASGTGVTVGERIIFPGGFDGAAPRRDEGGRDVSAVQEFDSRTDRWTLLPPLRGTTGASSLGVLDGRLFLLDSFFEPEESYVYDLATGRSVYFRLEPEDNRESVATVVGDRMYLVGGASPDKRALPSASIRVYELNPNWKSTAGIGGPIKPRPVAAPRG